MIYIAVLEQQTSFFDQAYELKVNGTSVEFSLSQMTAVDTAAAPKAFKTKIYDAIIMMDGVSAPIRNFKVYSYKLGTLTSGQKVEGVQKTWTVKSQRPEQETVDIMSACYIGSDDGAKPSIKNPHIAVNLHCGVYADETSLTGFAKLLSKSISSIKVEF